MNNYNNNYNQNYNPNNPPVQNTQNHFQPNGYTSVPPITQGSSDFVNNAYYYEKSVQSDPTFFEKKAEKENLRKVGNRIGVGLLIFEAITVAVSIFVLIPLMFTGAYDMSKYKGSSGLEPVAMYLLNAILSLVGFGSAGIITAKINGLRLDDVIHIKKTKLSDSIMISIAGMCFVIVFNILLALMNINLSLFGGFENKMSDYGMPTNIIGYILYFVCIAIIPPIIEEFIFRGAILGTLQKKFGDALAIIVSAVLFGLMHANFVQTPVTFLTGLVLGYITVKTGSIIPSIFLHFVNNSFAVISTIIMNSFDNEIVFDLVDIGSSILFIVIGLIFASRLIKKYKNDLFVFNKEKTQFTMSKQLTYIFTSPCMIAFILLSLGSCVMAMGLT